VFYDKVGDRVEDDYNIEESDGGDNFETIMADPSKRRQPKYKYKATKAVDNEAELDKLLTIDQPFTFDEDE
jgi:transglutaminase/protease-like cytokinesis protein 3